MDALEMALKMETDAVQFYTDAAQKTKSPVGKKMLLAIAEDEKRHYEMISQIIKGLQVTAKDVSPLKNVKSIFETMKSEMTKKIEASSDEMEAFKIAMKMEQEGADYYKKTLAKSTKDKEKALLTQLIKEEQQHYAIFSDTYEYLAKTGRWFLWEESPIRSMVEGG
jgi:rubrerythrin